jgi:hypothetical protein
MNKFLNTINSIIKYYNINIDNGKTSAVYILLAKHIEILVFNIVSIAAIISLLNNSSHINKDCVKLVKSYINNKCDRQIKGGTSLPSDYFGVSNPAYSENNLTPDILNIDFSSGILRPQIGGGGYKKYKLTKNDEKEFITVINSIVKYYNLKISSDVIKIIIEIITENMGCLFINLKLASKPLNIDLIKKMIKLNKKFDIFK